jgi:hypothetical protein
MQNYHGIFTKPPQPCVRIKKNNCDNVLKKKIVAQYAQSQHGIFTKPLDPNTRKNKCSHHGVSKNTRTHKNLKKCNAFDGVSKEIRKYYTICTKFPKPRAKTNKNLKKCSAFDGVSKDVGNCQTICKPLEPHPRTNKVSVVYPKNTRDYSTISTKPQDPCTRVNKRHKTQLRRNKRRLSHTTKNNTQKNDYLKLQMQHKLAANIKTHLVSQTFYQNSTSTNQTLILKKKS